MRRPLLVLSFGSLAFVAAFAAALAACTQDFGVFEPDGTSDGGGGDAKSDGARDGAADAGGDGSCSVPKGCTDTASACGQQCRTTRTQCEAMCPSGGAGSQCRSNCRQTETTCRTTCTNACVACGADAGCPGRTFTCQNALP